MPLPRTLNSYLDVKRVADSVIEQQSPCTVSFTTRAECTRWCQRFYTYRSLLLAAQEKQGVIRASTPYDVLILRKDKNGLSARIEFIDNGDIAVKFDDPAATVLPLQTTAPPAEETTFDEDDLLSAALNLAGKLDK